MSVGSAQPEIESVLPPWPLPPGWLLHDDGELVVASKPAGVSIAAPERGATHDLTARVRALRQSASRQDYLCPHVHVDRDVSGLVVFATHRTMNAALAAPGAIRVTHVVACVAPEGFNEQGQLTAGVVKDRNGIFRPAGNARHAQSVSIEYRLVARRDNRVLLEIPNQSSSRLLRAVLAANELPVVGDLALGGPAASHLLVHGASLRFNHPRSGAPIRFDAPTPWYVEAWMCNAQSAHDLTPSLFQAALAECASLRFGQVTQDGVDACRLVHGEAEDLLGVDVERFGRHAVVWVHDQMPMQVSESITDSVHALGWDGTYLKVRPKQASRIVDARQAALASAHAARGTDAPEDLVVREGGASFLVRLGDGLSTGLFLDQRPNRCWLRTRAAGKVVLNLFAFTCSFTAVAALGGARRTVSVDASKRYLQLGKRNLRLNGIDSGQHEFVCDDVGAWIQRALGNGERFDIILLDPPSFGTSRGKRFSVMSDYVSLATSCFSLLSEHGELLACTNHRRVTRRKLRGWLREAAHRAGRSGLELMDAPMASDFPCLPGAEPHMKALICRVDARARLVSDRDARPQGRSSRRQRTKKRGRSSAK